MPDSYVPSLPICTTLDVAASQAADIFIDERRSVACQPIIASDAFVVGDIDFANPAEVKDALAKMTFGHLFSDESIQEACRRGAEAARDLFLNCAMDQNHPHVQAMRDWIDPSVDNLWKVEDLEERAFLIIASHLYGTDEARRDLISSVKDAGVFGPLAQANLQEPGKTCRRPPRRYRPRHRSRSPDILPSLFSAFGADEQLAATATVFGQTFSK